METVNNTNQEFQTRLIIKNMSNLNRDNITTWTPWPLLRKQIVDILYRFRYFTKRV